MADNFLLPDFTLQGELTYFDFTPLNHGGYGITYRAKATFLYNRIKQTLVFAVKEFFPRDLATRNADGSVRAAAGKEHDFQECLEEFRREGRMLHDLNHTGIVPVNEVIEANGTIYFVMSYLGDMNLTRYVAEHGGHLGEEEARRIMDKLLDSVGYLHKQQLNHLDIKPDNVMMVDSDSNDKVPVLIDFGVSKHFHANGKQTSRLGGKGVTDGFSPMEQYVGIKSFSPKADIYALGATYFYMLTGKAPLVATDINEEWIRASLPKAVSEQTADAVCKAMRRDYSQRTGNVKDFFDHTEGDGDKDAEKGQLTKPLGSEKNDKRFWGGIQAWLTGTLKKTNKLIAIGLAAIALIGIIFMMTKGKAAEPTAYEEFTVEGVSFKMVRVEGGTFQMGATKEQGDDAYGNEKPVHSVTLSDYMIGETEVTQELWEAVMGTTVSQQCDKASKGWSLRGEGKDYPMYYVSWDECKEFIEKLNTLTGKHFRLPTESEWEFAARGGNKSCHFKYSGSDTIGDVAWYDGNSSSNTHSVGTKKANELGLYDMSGNVWEWCEDRYGSYSGYSQTDPKGRVLRGGSWLNYARYCRVSHRLSSTPDDRGSSLGLRLAL